MATDTRSTNLLDAMESAHREEIEREARRRELMATIARHRWQIARNHHRLETGEPLDFTRYPYQPAIYQDDALEQVVMGAVQWGKSEFLVATAAAMAACGLRVFYVISKYDKRDKFVASRITPAFREIPLYAAMLKAARDRSADADSQRFKHFGPGSINFVGSNSDKDFTSYSADSTIIDEHQECVLENINRVDGRMSGSSWRYKIICGILFGQKVEEAMENSVGDALYNLMTGTGTLKDALLSFARDVVRAFSQMAAHNIVGALLGTNSVAQGGQGVMTPLFMSLFGGGKTTTTTPAAVPNSANVMDSDIGTVGGSRIVALPDYQGLGIGTKLAEAVAQIYREMGKRVSILASHPAVLRHCEKSPLWRLTGVCHVASTTRHLGSVLRRSPSSGTKAVFTFAAHSAGTTIAWKSCQCDEIPSFSSFSSQAVRLHRRRCPTGQIIPPTPTRQHRHFRRCPAGSWSPNRRRRRRLPHKESVPLSTAWKACSASRLQCTTWGR